MRRLIVSADDFGLSVAVNEAVEQAHRSGVLTTASLMVAGPATADAVRRARAMPGLAVGLHLVVIDGPSVLPAAELPRLVDPAGQFPRRQVQLGCNYFFRPRIRALLAAEIRAQFAAFAATGLRLDHANAHKHMHLHPTVGRLLIDIGRQFGLRAVRIPAEPPAVLAACGTRPSFGDRALFAWTRWLRRKARQAGLVANDHCFGIAWSGAMTTERLQRLVPCLPDGISEIYLHPASRADRLLRTLMPDYCHEAELAALLDPELRACMQRAGRLTSFGALADEKA
ncbi:MAG TPA: hopanoid biosynthesis-associated protein HpnK [Acetobacteraceae bacterium]|nr:hopanoid biosynthesis-associated protein HpnK [Acetobacteraceae bacterium]